MVFSIAQRLEGRNGEVCEAAKFSGEPWPHSKLMHKFGVRSYTAWLKYAEDHIPKDIEQIYPENDKVSLSFDCLDINPVQRTVYAWIDKVKERVERQKTEIFELKAIGIKKDKRIQELEDAIKHYQLQDHEKNIGVVMKLRNLAED